MSNGGVNYMTGIINIVLENAVLKQIGGGRDFEISGIVCVESSVAARAGLRHPQRGAGGRWGLAGPILDKSGERAHSDDIG
jgi:hypothetical protein